MTQKKQRVIDDSLLGGDADIFAREEPAAIAREIPVSPGKHTYNNIGETLTFTFVFPAIPKDTYYLNLFEDEISPLKYQQKNHTRATIKSPSLRYQGKSSSHGTFDA